MELPTRSISKTVIPGVDAHCPIRNGRTVKKYSTVLCCSDVETNNNKYYIMEVISVKHRCVIRYILYTRHGRIGTPGTVNLKYTETKDESIKAFCAKYYEKTGNRWGQPFKYKAGRYVPMDIDSGGIEPVDPSEVFDIDPRVMRIMRDFLAIEERHPTMLRITDEPSAPLGKVTEDQLNSACVVLSRITDIVTNSASRDELPMLSSMFWSLVPTQFPMLPPVIDSEARIEECAQIIDTIRGLRCAIKLIREHDNSIASAYKSLTPLKVASPKELEQLTAWINTTRGTTHYHTFTLHEAFSIQPRTPPSQQFQNDPNRILLFHGTIKPNMISILSEGLRVPHESQVAHGSVLGRGIYFSSVFTKSLQYCGNYLTKYVLVYEVALGDTKLVYTTDAYDTRPDSKTAYGRMGPLKENRVRWVGDSSVEIPMGPLSTREFAEGTFLYDEYVIFSADRCYPRYILELT